MVYIGDTTITDYNDYVDACQSKGFNVDYSKGEDYYYADDVKGWHISLRYEGNNVMSIDIDAPDNDDTSITTTTSSTTTTTEASEKPTKESDNKNISGNFIDPDFKKAMDSYEEFMDEYVDFMKKYNEDPSDLKLLASYADYLNKYADFVEKYEKWEDEDLNNAEMAYYIDVQTRVSKKLLEIS